MSYSCSDFVDTILDALKIDVPEESADSPSDQADLVLAELDTRDTAARDMLTALKLVYSRMDEAYYIGPLKPNIRAAIAAAEATGIRAEG